MIGTKTAVGAIAVALAGAGAASATVPSYDAKTQPDQASQAMNSFCQQQGSCSFSSPPSVSNQLGPFRALSDKIINCNTADANGLGEHALLSEAETTQTDTRGQGTTLEEALDVSVKVGILQTELEASTKQFEQITSGMEIKQDVPVPAGYEGYVVTRWPTVTASGTITDGIHFQVTSFELSYPGFGTTGGDLSKIYVAPLAEPLVDKTAKPPRDDFAKYCTGLPPIAIPGALATAHRGLVISVCVARVRGCQKRRLDLTNASRLLSGNASVALARGSRVYASGTYRHGAITVHAARRLRRGVYTVFINRRGQETMASAVLR